MRALLDTCVLLWLTQEPTKLSAGCRSAIDTPDVDLLVSHASVWEMALKSQAGKLEFPTPLRRWLADQRKEWQFDYVPITVEHILRTCEIERHHVDPFDRLLIAQALVNDLVILTPDDMIARYPVQTVW